jgi:hypothetical protein
MEGHIHTIMVKECTYTRVDTEQADDIRYYGDIKVQQQETFQHKTASLLLLP